MLKTNENAMNLHGLDVLEDVVRVFVLSLDVLGVQRSDYVFLIQLFAIVPKSNRDFLIRPLDTLIVSLVGVQGSV